MLKNLWSPKFMLSTVWNQHILKIVGLATKHERAKNERERMSEELRDPLIQVRWESLYFSWWGWYLQKYH
jgi:hypothetical protein